MRPALIPLAALITVLVTVAATRPITAQGDPPCLFNLRNPFVAPGMCAEVIYEEALPDAMDAIGAVAFGPDGALYFARPAARQIARLPARGDGTFSPAEAFAADLPEPPLGLVYHPDQGVWYASTDRLILRIAQDGSARPLVSDLPGGAGGWLGNLRVGPDGNLYVVKGVRCDSCADPDPRRGALLRLAPDGSAVQVVATGLREVFDMAWGPDGTLYLADNAPPDQPAELNAIQPGMAAPDFGFPSCDSAGRPRTDDGGGRCAAAIRPVWTFPAGSTPRGLLRYDGAAFPAWHGKLLIGLAGTWNGITLAGFEVVALTLAAEGAIAAETRLLPDYFNLPAAELSLIRASYYPYRVAGIAADRAGWLYTAVSEGRIYRFRPKP
jgi:glucose/arabinose dehydrogenase